MASQVDFAIAFGLVIAMASLLFGYIYFNLNNQIESSKLNELYYSSDYISNLVINNLETEANEMRLELKELLGVARTERMNISIEFNSDPTYMKIYDDLMNQIPYSQSGNEITFDVNFNANEKKYLKIIYEGGSVARAIDLNQMQNIYKSFLSEKKIKIIDESSIQNFNYAYFKELAGRKFKIKSNNFEAGEEPAGSIVLSKKSVLMRYSDGSMRRSFISILVW